MDKPKSKSEMRRHEIQKPREFWLVEMEGTLEVCSEESVFANTQIHVIEYSAYEAEKKKNERPKPLPISQEAYDQRRPPPPWELMGTEPNLTTVVSTGVDHPDSLRKEISKLRAIIRKELHENDGLGMEFVYVTILKDEVAELKEKVKNHDQKYERTCVKLGE